MSSRVSIARLDRAGAWLALLAAVVLGPVSGPRDAFAVKPQALVSWHAPYGMPRATDYLVTACDDTAEVDTLYLSFVVDRARPGLDSVIAVVYLDPAPGQSLGDFWAFKTGEANGGNLFVEFAPFADAVGQWPWNGIGDARLSYSRRPDRARLEMTFNVPDYAVIGLEEDTPYVFARIRIHHRHDRLSGCDQPVCIEWGVASLVFSTGRTLEIEHGPHRFAIWNGGGSDVCGSRRPSTGAKPWRPPVPDRTPLKP